jgi:hypothetical protein
MSEAADAKPPVIKPAPPQSVVLRKLFLMLFVRGRSSRGLGNASSRSPLLRLFEFLRRRRSGGSPGTMAPPSIASKLALTLFVYSIIGFWLAMMMIPQPLFTMSFLLHSATVGFLGMFVASSAGEVLFNKEEGDILLHRPVSSVTMLWAKVRVLVEVSLWLAGAFNLVAFFVGAFKAETGWLFPFAHMASTAMEALFCTSCVVVIYQLCLRWIGRERLDGLMTTTQVFFTIAIVVGGQVVPRLMFRADGTMTITAHAWWMGLLPPGWFAGFDNAVANGGGKNSWMLAIAGVAATAGVMWIAFGRLAESYETGLQRLAETASRPKRQGGGGRRWVDVLISVPPLRWWLRDSISRGSFLLVTAYLMRDRDVKLRVYPGLAPLMVMPFIFLLQPGGMRGGGLGQDFGVAFAGAYLGLVPMLSLNMLQYSQQWQASDIFRVAPMLGPMELCNGARRAVLFLLTLPLLLVFAITARLVHHDNSTLLLLLPGVIALPVYALVPCLLGQAVPLSKPTEEAKSANRGLLMVGVMLVSFVVSGVAYFAWKTGFFWWYLLVEIVMLGIAYWGMRKALARLEWSPAE